MELLRAEYFLKPEILIQPLSTAGWHNGDPKRTKARVDKSKAWKRQGIIKLTPAGGSIPAKVALAHESLIYPPNNACVRLLAIGMEVGEAYSTAIEQIIRHPQLGDLEMFPYLLTVEHDNAPPPDGVLKLLEHMEANPRLSAISGAYWTKGEGGSLQAWGDPSDPVLNFRPLPPPADGRDLLECCGLGMGFVLHRMKMFHDKKIPRPWFVTQAGKDGVSTQDLYFWRNARPAGHRCAVAMDVPVGHYDSKTGIMW